MFGGVMCGFLWQPCKERFFTRFFFLQGALLYDIENPIPAKHGGYFAFAVMIEEMITLNNRTI